MKPVAPEPDSRYHGREPFRRSRRCPAAPPASPPLTSPPRPTRPHRPPLPSVSPPPVPPPLPPRRPPRAPPPAPSPAAPALASRRPSPFDALPEEPDSGPVIRPPDVPGGESVPPEGAFRGIQFSAGHVRRPDYRAGI